MHRTRICTLTLLGVLAVLPLATAQAYTVTSTCDPAENPPGVDCTVDVVRSIDVYYGTLTPSVGAAQDAVELSSRISGSLSNAVLLDPGVDARIRAVFASWVDPAGPNSLDWVTEQAATDVFPAQANLLADYAAAAGTLESMFGPGTLSFDAAIARGNPQYVLANDFSFGTDFFGNDPGCANPDSCIILSNFSGRLNLYELNATWTLREPAGVPEPPALVLVLVGVLAVAMTRQRAIERAIGR